MTRSSNHPDADSTPNDFGLPEKLYGAWDEFTDWETNELLERDITPL